MMYNFPWLPRQYPFVWEVVVLHPADVIDAGEGLGEQAIGYWLSPAVEYQHRSGLLTQCEGRGQPGLASAWVAIDQQLDQ